MVAKVAEFEIAASTRAHERFYYLVKEQLDPALTEWSAPEATDRIVELIASDEQFFTELALGWLRDHVYRIVLGHIRMTRLVAGDVDNDESVARANEVLRRHKEDRKSVSSEAYSLALTVVGNVEDRQWKASKWNVWREHAGTRHILLPEMTKADLLLAAQERRTRAETELALACTWEALAGQMDDSQRVRDRFSPGEVDAEISRHKAAA